MKFLGNLLYLIPVSEYFSILERFLSGAGNGAVGVLFGANRNLSSRTRIYEHPFPPKLTL